MSATGRGAQRQADDFYATPAWATRAILPHLVDGPDTVSLVLDPCAGRGAILGVLGEWALERGAPGRRLYYGLVLDAERTAAARGAGLVVETRDALALKSWAGSCCGPRPTLIITNPPYSLAMQLVVRALSEVTPGGTVAMLLRLNWLASKGRAGFHKKHPSDVYVLDRRPEFVASLSCSKKKHGCSYKETQELEAARPKACPLCGAKVNCSTTDATEYCWMCWGPGRGNRWFLLDTEAAA
jgi:hypothetical protein